jgi:hypothetical protein
MSCALTMDRAFNLTSRVMDNQARIGAGESAAALRVAIRPKGATVPRTSGAPGDSELAQGARRAIQQIFGAASCCGRRLAA